MALSMKGSRDHFLEVHHTNRIEHRLPPDIWNAGNGNTLITKKLVI